VLRLAIAAMVIGIGCATTARPVEVETVGQLSASETHVAQAPVHATTDLTPGGFVATESAEDDAGMTVSSGPVETPDVAPKAGLVMGGAR
jgi:hypothetical protein